MQAIYLPRVRARTARACAILLLGLAAACFICLAARPTAADAAVEFSAPTTTAASSTTAGSSLEAVASKAGDTGRKVAMSLIGLAFAVAGIVLAFRRDFKEAAGVFAVGIVAVLMATPAGISLLQETVNSLLGVQ
jgi:hypothetical protein